MKIPENAQAPKFNKNHRITADTVLENRLNFCKTLISKRQFSASVYASYFEIPLSKVEEDVTSLGYKLDEAESKKPISFAALNVYRKKILEKNSSKEMLEKLGLWHMPTKDKETIYHYQADDVNSRLDSALEYYQTERLMKKQAYGVVADKFTVPFKEFKNTVVNNNLQRIEHSFVDKYKEDLKELLNTSTSLSVSKLTGMPQTCFHNLAREVSQEYKETHSNLLGDHIPTPRAYQKEQRRETVWNMYNAYGSTHGYTQQEIADQLGITRATVIHDIKAYKKEHPDVIDVTQLYRARHSGLEKALNRIEKKAVATSLYVNGESIQNISKELHSDYETIKLYLMEDGLIQPYTSTKYQDDLIKEDASNSSEVGYQHKGQFTEGKIYGATSDLLNQKNAPSPSANWAERNRIRSEILNDQRQTMAAIRNDPVAYNEFVSKQGRMVDFMKYAELQREDRQIEDPDIGMEM